MNRILNHSYNFLVADYRLLNRGLLFSKALFGFVVLKCCYWLFNFDSQFSTVLHINNNIPKIGAVKDFAFLLTHLANSKINFLVIGFVFLSSISQILLKRSLIWLRVLVWLAVVNLHNFTFVGLSGGDYLLNQFLFFNCFIGSYSNSKLHWVKDLKVILHNISTSSCIVLLCLVYLTSGLSKILQGDWQNGTAVNFILNAKHYSLPWFYETKGFSWINYLVILFQLTFSLGIWFRVSRKYYLMGGTLFHLSIFVVMGLLNFSVLMLIPYLLLFDTRFPFGMTTKKAGK